MEFNFTEAEGRMTLKDLKKYQEENPERFAELQKRLSSSISHDFVPKSNFETISRRTDPILVELRLIRKLLEKLVEEK